MNIIKLFKNMQHGLFYSFIISRSKTVTFGDECTWTIDPSGLSQQSVVYSAGVGGDVSFEKQLIKQFGCDIILLDPSPTGAATMSLPENNHPKLKFESVGLAERDGEILLGVPENSTKGSYFMASCSKNGLTFPCWSLPTLMREHRHEHIDLLKIDIEGFEYGVLKQICTQKLPIKQMYVEFHHSSIPAMRREQTIGAIIRFLRSGNKPIHRNNRDQAFITA